MEIMVAAFVLPLTVAPTATQTRMDTIICFGFQKEEIFLSNTYQRG
jgi:hypothetical protein